MKDKIIIGKYSFNTIIAITEDDHINGLMYKKWPPPIMSFPYNKAEVRKFWMRNTISPLDILFCFSGKVVDICLGKPLSLELLGPDQPTDLVIELPKGTVSKCSICVGDSVDLKYSVGTLGRKILKRALI